VEIQKHGLLALCDEIVRIPHESITPVKSKPSRRTHSLELISISHLPDAVVPDPASSRQALYQIRQKLLLLEQVVYPRESSRSIRKPYSVDEESEGMINLGLRCSRLKRPPGVRVHAAF